MRKSSSYDTLLRPLQKKNLFLIVLFQKIQRGMRFLFYFFFHEIFKTNTVGMGNFPIFHQKIPVLGFATLLLEKIIAVLVERGVWGAWPPVVRNFLKF